MAIHFRCLRCDRPLSVETRKAGQTVHCPACNTNMNVPETAGAPAVPRAVLIGFAITLPLVGLVIALPFLLPSGDAAGFDAVRQFLEAELMKVKGG